FVLGCHGTPVRCSDPRVVSTRAPAGLGRAKGGPVLDRPRRLVVLSCWTSLRPSPLRLTPSVYIILFYYPFRLAENLQINFKTSLIPPQLLRHSVNKPRPVSMKRALIYC